MRDAPKFPRSQRWFSHRSFYRPSQEPIDVAEFGVEAIGQRTAKDFVVAHHYSRSFPYSIQSFGLFRKTSAFEASRLVGVATFATPSNPNSMRKWCGLESDAGAELGRFVLLAECAGNAETWFLARALRGFKAQRPTVKCILSYSDPHPRKSAAGEVVFPGHTGGIYSAANAYYCGRASPKTLFLNREGQALANRVLSKIRNGERGCDAAQKLLIDFTGLVRDPFETSGAFVDRALATLHAERHSGNHLYLFPLASDRREKEAILSLPVIRERTRGTLASPKFPDLAVA